MDSSIKCVVYGRNVAQLTSSVSVRCWEADKKHGENKKKTMHIHNILNYVCDAEKWLFGVHLLFLFVSDA